MIWMMAKKSRNPPRGMRGRGDLSQNTCHSLANDWFPRTCPWFARARKMVRLSTRFVGNTFGRETSKTVGGGPLAEKTVWATFDLSRNDSDHWPHDEERTNDSHALFDVRVDVVLHLMQTIVRRRGLNLATFSAMKTSANTILRSTSSGPFPNLPQDRMTWINVFCDMISIYISFRHVLLLCGRSKQLFGSRTVFKIVSNSICLFRWSLFRNERLIRSLL